MRVSQVEFAAEPGKRDGQPSLLARSRDIDGRLVEQLLPWVPAYGELHEGQTEGLSFFRPAAHRLALCRSVWVQPLEIPEGERAVWRESPARSGAAACAAISFSRSTNNFRATESRNAGSVSPIPDPAAGSRLWSRILILDPQQLQGYGYNAAVLFHVARSLGHLFQQPLRGVELPTIHLPDRTVLRARDLGRPLTESHIESVSRALDIHRQAAVFVRGNPMAFLCSYLAEIPAERRWMTSFATGTQVSVRRPTQLHLFPASRPWLKRDLVQRQIRTLAIEDPCDSAALPAE